jgi:hypothetical protein
MVYLSVKHPTNAHLFALKHRQSWCKLKRKHMIWKAFLEQAPALHPFLGNCKFGNVNSTPVLLEEKSASLLNLIKTQNSFPESLNMK